VKAPRLAGVPFFPLCLLAACLAAGCAKGRGEVTVRNQTGQDILEGYLRIGPRTFDLAGLGQGQTRSFPFSSGECSPADYRLRLRLGKHRQTLVFIGSVRNGMDYDDQLTVGRDEIVLESAQNPSNNRNIIYKGTQSKKIKWFE
jgi:hypothetical protein